jgi:hypothetical protein
MVTPETDGLFFSIGPLGRLGAPAYAGAAVSVEWRSWDIDAEERKLPAHVAGLIETHP